MPRRFEISEPGRDPRMTLALLMFVPTVLVLVGVYTLLKPTPPPFLPLAILAVEALQVLFVSRWIDRREVSLDAGVLHLQAGNRKLVIAASALASEQAKVLRLDEHPELRPALRTGGMALPGVALGWFRTRTRMSVFCVLTDRQRVLMLPARDGKRVVLLSLKRPDALLAALRDADDGAVTQR